MPGHLQQLPTANVTTFLYGDGVEPFDPAEVFHEASKLYPSALGRGAGRWLLEDEAIQATLSRAIKRYAHVPVLQLPPYVLPPAPFAAILLRRRTRREFVQTPLLLTHLATLLYAAYGVTDESDGNAVSLFRFRTVPSGGALYPLEVYVAIGNVDGVQPGLYHYDPSRHLLEELRKGAVFALLEESLVQPEIMLHSAGAVLIITALFWRSRIKYGLRGYRFALMEAGHCAQNVLLAGEALGLGMVPVGGFVDSKVEGLLGVDGVNESPLYLIIAGHRIPDMSSP